MTTFGIDLGGTSMRCAAVDEDGRVLAHERRETPMGGWPAVIEAGAELVTSFAVRFPRAHNLGVGAAGMVDRDGVMCYAPNIVGLESAPLQDAWRERLSMPVIVDNDANVAAYGELVHGAARGVSEALMITLGTGIGGGIIVGGQVLRGRHGFAAEVGHFQIEADGPRCACGEVGHWEAFASGTALGRMARDWARDGRLPAVVDAAGGDCEAVAGTHLGEAVLAGDGPAGELLDHFADYVAIGLAGLVNILDPERIVISGGLVVLGDRLIVPIQRALTSRIEGSTYRPVVQVVAAALGPDAGVIGAAALARGLE